MIYIAEDWKTITYKDIKRNKYEISSCGRIRNKNTKQILSMSFDSNGYYQSSFSTNKKKKRRTCKIHKLVFFHFGNIDDIQKYVDGNQEKPTYCINHINGIKTDNFIWNLECVTYTRNNIHAVEMGLTKKGEDAFKAKDWISNDLVENICKLLSEHYSYKDIIKKLNLDNGKSTKYILIDIKRRKSWKHISKKYIF